MFVVVGLVLVFYNDVRCFYVDDEKIVFDFFECENTWIIEKSVSEVSTIQLAQNGERKLMISIVVLSKNVSERS